MSTIGREDMLDLHLRFESAENLAYIALIAEALEFDMRGNFYPSDEAYLGQARKLRNIAGIMRELADRVDSNAARHESKAAREPLPEGEKNEMLHRFLSQIIGRE